MKVLTVVIPVYNTEKYLRRCLDSILLRDICSDIEVIAVNDGGRDGSINILNEYKSIFPNTLIVIDKENGGHGSVINVGLQMATGKYFKVVDSDDWVNSADFIRLVGKLKEENADLVVTNYKKEYVYNGVSEYLKYRELESEKIYDFCTLDLSILNKEYFVMATSTYKTEVLRKSNLVLLEKTFYVDMQYNAVPILSVDCFVYYDLDIYRYFIGRPDQSINVESFVRNRAHHDSVIRYLVEFYCEHENLMCENKKEYIQLIIFYMLTTHYYIYCVYNAHSNRAIRKEISSFDKYLKQRSTKLYNLINMNRKIRYNRKTNFIFIEIGPKVFNKLIDICGRLLKKFGEL